MFNQLEVLSGHSWMPCLVYQMLRNSEAKIFKLYDNVKGRRHELIFSLMSWWKEVLKVCILIHERKLKVYVDRTYIFCP